MLLVWPVTLRPSAEGLLQRRRLPPKLCCSAASAAACFCPTLKTEAAQGLATAVAPNADPRAARVWVPGESREHHRHTPAVQPSAQFKLWGAPGGASRAAEHWGLE